MPICALFVYRPARRHEVVAQIPDCVPHDVPSPTQSVLRLISVHSLSVRTRKQRYLHDKLISLRVQTFPSFH